MTWDRELTPQESEVFFVLEIIAGGKLSRLELRACARRLVNNVDASELDVAVRRLERVESDMQANWYGLGSSDVRASVRAVLKTLVMWQQTAEIKP